MSVEQDSLADVAAVAHRILLLVGETPPHIRPWLRGIEAEAEHIHVEITAVNNRASRRFLSWLFAGLDVEGELDRE